MNWEDILKADSPLLEKTTPKQKKKIKKLLQSVQPTEYMGQDFTQLGDLINELKSVGMMKSKSMKKKINKIDEGNLTLVARSADLRKDYEILYRQLRGMVYPKSKGNLGEEKDEWRKWKWDVTALKRVSK